MPLLALLTIATLAGMLALWQANVTRPNVSALLLPDPDARFLSRELNLAGPVTLTAGARYQAKVHLTGIEGWATPSQVKDALFALGFNPLEVWNIEDAPASFPDRTPEPGGATFAAVGTWSKATVTEAAPDKLARAWVLA